MMRYLIQGLRRRTRREERGAVMVLVAAGLPAFIFLAAFVLDVGHWYDYSRNLQLRADAAALATGVEYGNACFNSPTTVQTDPIGEVAQQYAGPPGQDPASPYVIFPTNPNNLPFGYGSVPQPYQNVPGLSRGMPQDYHLLLNSNAYWPNGVDWNMGSDQAHQQDSTALCSSTDGSDTAPMTDVRITQANIPLFFPLLNFQPTISAHARVEMQGIQELGANLSPIAVRDASFTPCVYANFLDNDGNTIQTAKLTRIPNSTLWTNAGSPATVTPVAGDPVTVQLNINSCSATNPDSQLYNSGTPSGLVYIDNWGTPAAPGANGAPALAAGGVKLTGASGTICDPYFETNPNGCSGLGVDANVAFQNGVTLGGPSPTAFVTATIGNQTINLAYTGTGNEWNTAGATSPNTFNIAADSGATNVTIKWKQTSGKVGGTTCTTNSPCSGTVPGFGAGDVQQRVFAGLDGDNLCGNGPTNDTGPVRWLTVGTTDGLGATMGYNAIPNAIPGPGTAAHLYVTTSIEGLSNAPPTDTSAQDVCLRLRNGNGNNNTGVSHATGLVDCGQGNGTVADSSALENGCPDPVQVDTRVQQPDGNLTCNPAITPRDCVQNNPGDSPPILRAFDDRMGSPNCSPNNWPNVTLSDPRTFVFILLAPTDLLNVHGTADIPIRGFGVFYVTGWSTGPGGVQGCANGTNDPPPPGSSGGQLWGHFSSIFIPSGSGSGNGTGCNTNQLGDCIAVLTR